MINSATIDKNLIQQYQQCGPRYTSYPAAVHFHDGFNHRHYNDIARHTNEDLIPSSLSLYLHIPFCRHVCFYCACNRIITNNSKKAASYLENLRAEIRMQGKLFDRDRVVEQLHWGGGTPTFLDHDQIRKLMDTIRNNFSLREDDKGDYSIELDPRELQGDTIHILRETGFNRISIGVQDFDPLVQKSINRVQTVEETQNVILAARHENFHSVNVDLIYGLPGQTVKSFVETLETVVALNPDRIAVYNYAHLPHLFKSQCQIDENLLPTAETRIEILQEFVKFLTAEGYLYIGMDHFARPNDDLVQAQLRGTLHRNFQGYSTRAGCDLVGMGVSAISSIGSSYAQNTRSLQEYNDCIKNGKIPVMRGIKLDYDDLLRRDVINKLICNFRINYSDIEELHCIDFEDYFYDELISLEKMQDRGLLAMDSDSIVITPKGRYLVRNICMVFDKYMTSSRFTGNFSRVI